MGDIDTPPDDDDDDDDDDSDDMSVTVNYHTRQVGRVLHKAMKGGLQGDSTTGLTAYVVISLLEADVARTVCQWLCIKPGFHPNAIACVACVAFGWKPGFRS